MSRLLAIVLCIALLAQHLARFSVAGVYELRKEFVAKNLCENRDRPELACCGKCVLSKQLAKADEGAGDSNHLLKRTEPPESVVVRSCSLFRPGHVSSGFVPRPYNPGVQRMYDSGLHSRIFRPPAA